MSGQRLIRLNGLANLLGRLAVRFVVFLLIGCRLACLAIRLIGLGVIWFLGWTYPAQALKPRRPSAVFRLAGVYKIQSGKQRQVLIRQETGLSD